MNIIETDRLILREYTLEDTALLHTILSDPLTMQFWPSPFTLEQSENWVKINIERYKNLGFGRWSLVIKKTEQVIGDCGLMISEIDGKEENDLGYIIHHKFWRNGYAYEAAEACKHYAFKSLGLERLCANMPFNHTGSERVAQKLGMVKEKEFLNKRNRNILTYLYSITREI